MTTTMGNRSQQPRGEPISPRRLKPRARLGGYRSARAQLVAKRLLALVPVLLGISLRTFWIFDVMPGNAAESLLGPDATTEQIAQLEARLGLDRPAGERYLEWA